MSLKIQKILILALLATTFSINLLQTKTISEQPQQTPSKLPQKIIAGEVHYSRIPVQYWQHRIKMIKAMGFNALSVYVMWNYHEVSKGVYDYKSGNRNLGLFLEMAKKNDMYVLIRPGPYVCAEWDFGGMPARLLSVPNIKLRANNKVFLEEVRTYFTSLVPIMSPYLASAGGTIILLQIQNQYGFYGTDKSYIEAIRKMWKQLNFICDEYYVDIVENLKKCHWTGANIGINNGIQQVQYDYARSIEKNGLIFGGEIYSGWITHWGEKWAGKTKENYIKEFQFFFKYNHSFSMYMVHGGSNFGLTAGANGVKNQKYDYLATVTSYDYDAPIDEQGSPTYKYDLFRGWVQQYLKWQLPAVPPALPIIQIAPFTPTQQASLFANLPKALLTNSTSHYPFETDSLKMFDQGIVLYETMVKKMAGSYLLKVVVHDFGLAYLDGVFVGMMNRSESTIHQLDVECSKDEGCKLQILVEAMGHVNFDHDMNYDFKGLITFNDTRKNNYSWNIYTIPISSEVLSWSKTKSDGQRLPSLSRSTINIQNVGDTWFNMKNYGKGYLWVNGINLGRYWQIGPEEKVFCPGVWLKEGDNVVQVLELVREGGSIWGDKTLK